MPGHCQLVKALSLQLTGCHLLHSCMRCIAGAAAITVAAAAGWGTILVMVDVFLSIISVLLYIVMTYHPINVRRGQL